MNGLLGISVRFTLDVPKANRKVQKSSEKPWIMKSKKTHPKLLFRPSMKVKPGSFGLFHCVNDDGIGRRVFNIHRFDVENSGKVLVEMTNGVPNAFVIEEGANKEDKKEMKGDVKVYDEKNSSKESMHDDTINISKVLKEFNHVVSVHIFVNTEKELDGTRGMADPEVDFQNYICLPNSELSVLSNAIHISCEGSPLSFKARVCLFEKFEEIMIKLKERGLVGEIC